MKLQKILDLTHISRIIKSTDGLNILSNVNLLLNIKGRRTWSTIALFRICEGERKDKKGNTKGEKIKNRKMKRHIIQENGTLY